MTETLKPQVSIMADEIGRLIKEVQSLRNKTSQLQQTTNSSKEAERELARLQQTQARTLAQIESLTNERERAIAQQNRSLADMKANQISKLRDVELPRVNNAITNKRFEIQDLERSEQKLHEERLQQLVNTFQSLHGGLAYVSRKDYFEKYVWLVYFRDKIGVRDLKPNELTSLSDRLKASEIAEAFEHELSQSENALTNEDKRDIDTYTTLVHQIPKDKKKLDEMKRNASSQSVSLQSLQNKLKRLNEMEGYPKEKLSAFRTWGVIALIVGLLLFVYGFISNKDATTPNNIIPIIGIAPFIAGIVLLWLRYKNDKEKRLAEATQKWERLSSQHSQHNEALKNLEAQILKEENDLEAIRKRRPILDTVEM